MTDTAEAEIYDEPKIDQETVKAMTMDERMMRLTEYRKKYQAGMKFSDDAYYNSVVILRAVRAKAVDENSYASKKAKKAAEVKPLDLDEF